ncbi:MAG: universal stress protein [Comamonadaceae bacterium]|jgi:nucleotide-binding universal stress UspA family protein|uniref:universal stress protein n=1 Tax=Hydrogenophaga sp. SNF1 TaxID=3098762 RepID=UPI002ACC0A68|nr:universal stress protein [Hydrogenophaga sp. SNF1]NCT98266.1 universal stress protein [Comamonadaceae bacterium]WQB83877.1 universal stress protein [Hydrogenophaga sp. SNF1]
MKILLAVDGSEYTKKMLAYLTTHDELFSADNDFSAITVQSPLPPRARAAVGADVANQYYEEEAAKVTGPVNKFLQRHGITAKLLHKTGSAGEVIAKTANSGKFDLVIMGSHGHGALGNLVLGSVATKVLAHCTAPVLIVR